MMIQFHQSLSEQSVYYRYFGTLSLSQRTTHERLIRMCCIDYDRELALLAVHPDTVGRRDRIVAVGRFIRLPDSADAEVAVIVADEFQGKGLGTHMVGQLLSVARQEGVRRIVANILPENQLMQDICKKFGFQLRFDSDDRVMRAELAV
jgi:acetyltransferase